MAVANPIERADQSWEKFVQLTLMIVGECVQHPSSFHSNFQSHAASVQVVLAPPDPASLLATLTQLNNAIVSQAQALRRVGDSGLRSIGCPRNVQQKLVLLRLHPSL